MVATENLDAILESHRALVEDLSFPTVLEWQARHPQGKVIGYFPVYAPLEIIHAGGLLPVGLMGAGTHVPVKEADSHFPSFVCSIPRTTMELALTGRLDFLAAVLFTPICDVGRNLSTIWQRSFPGVVSEMVSLPQNLIARSAIEYHRAEYQRLRRLLEEIAGTVITADALRKSIRLYNRQRRLLRELYALRQATPWKLSAAESYVVVRAGTFLPVEEHIRLLEQVLHLAPRRQTRALDKLRVLFEGGFCEQPPLEFLETMEEVCYVVDDDFGAALRWFLADVPEDEEPLLALARGYGELMGYSSVQHHGRKHKGAELLRKIRQARAEAAVLAPAKMCEPGLDDQVIFASHLKKAEVPYLCLEIEEKLTSFEDIRVQMETFTESLLFYA